MVVHGARPPDFLYSIVPVSAKVQGREYAQEAVAPSNGANRARESFNARYRVNCTRVAREDRLHLLSPLSGPLIPGIDFPQPRPPDEVLIKDISRATAYQELYPDAFKYHIGCCWICVGSFQIVQKRHAELLDRLDPEKQPRNWRGSKDTLRKDIEFFICAITGPRPWASCSPGCTLAAKCRELQQDHHVAQSEIPFSAEGNHEEYEDQEHRSQHHNFLKKVGKDNIQAWKSGAGRRKEWRKGGQKRIATRRQQIRTDNHKGRQKSQKTAFERRSTTTQPHVMLVKRQIWPLNTPLNAERGVTTTSKRRVRSTHKRQDSELLLYDKDGLCCDIPDDELDSYMRLELGHETKSGNETELSTFTQLTVTLAPELLCPPMSVQWDWVPADPLTPNTKGAVVLNNQSSLRQVRHHEPSPAQLQKEHLAHPLGFRDPFKDDGKEAAKYSTVLASNVGSRGLVLNQDSGRAQKNIVKKKRRTRNRGIRKLAIPHFRSIQHLGDFLLEKTHHLRQLEPATKAIRLERPSSQNIQDKEHKFIQAVEKKWNQLTALQRTYRLACQDVRRVNSVLEELILEESVYKEIVEEMNLDIEESLWMMRKNPVVSSRRRKGTEGLPLMHCWSQNGIEYDSELWDWLVVEDARMQAMINSVGGARQQGFTGAERSYGAICQNFHSVLKLLFDY